MLLFRTYKGLGKIAVPGSIPPRCRALRDILAAVPSYFISFIIGFPPGGIGSGTAFEIGFSVFRYAKIALRS